MVLLTPTKGSETPTLNNSNIIAPATALPATGSGVVTILTGDCLDMLPTLPAGSVQCVVTSPPYLQQRDYKTLPSRYPEITFNPYTDSAPVTIPAWEGCLGDESTIDGFVAHLLLIFRRLRPALKSNGVLWVNLGDKYGRGKRSMSPNDILNFDNKRDKINKAAARSGSSAIFPLKQLLGVPWRFALAMQADGWYLRSSIIWQKPDGMVESVLDRPTSSYEDIFLFANQASYYYDAAAIAEPCVDTDGVTRLKNRRNVWSLSRENYTGPHVATYPLKLARLCIEAGSQRGDTILDPFAGSGTTLRAATELGRLSIGIEINPANSEEIVSRTSTVQVKLPM